MPDRIVVDNLEMGVNFSFKTQKGDVPDSLRLWIYGTLPHQQCHAVLTYEPNANIARGGEVPSTMRLTDSEAVKLMNALWQRNVRPTRSWEVYAPSGVEIGGRDFERYACALQSTPTIDRIITEEHLAAVTAHVGDLRAVIAHQQRLIDQLTSIPRKV